MKHDSTATSTSLIATRLFLALLGACTSGSTVTDGSSRSRPRPTSLPIPGIIRGSLEESDQRSPLGSAFDEYEIRARAHEPITIVVRGGPQTARREIPLNMYIVLSQNGRELVHDDDSARSDSGLNSRIVFNPPSDGVYLLRVTSFGLGLREGSYVVQCYRGSIPEQI